MRTAAFMMVLLIVLVTTVALADVPGLINYQGTLTDESGFAIDTTASITFSIYTDSTGGSQVWTETQPAVEVDNGLFNILLGRVNAIEDTVFKDPSRWLGIQVGGDPELEPRQRIASVGYAFRSANTDTAEYARSAPAISDGDWTIVGDDMYSAVPGNVGIGLTSPYAKLDVEVEGGTAVRGISDAETGNKYGGYFTAQGEGSRNIGVIATAWWIITKDIPETMVGLWAYTSTGSVPPYPTGKWAGYFTGDVKITDSLRVDGNTSLGGQLHVLGNAICDGNLGIGTTSPAEKLHVAGDIRLNAGGDIAFADDNTRIHESSDDLYLEADDDIYISPDDDIRLDGSTLFIDGSANRVGIGTTSPSYKLDVSGDVRVTGSLYGTASDADKVDGYHAGNSSGQVAVSNGTECDNLNADMVDGKHASAFTQIYYDGLLSAGGTVTLVIPHYRLWTLQLSSGWPDDGGLCFVQGFENDWAIGITYIKYNGNGTSSAGGAEGLESSTTTLVNFGSGSYLYSVECPGEASGDHNIKLTASGVELKYRLVY